MWRIILRGVGVSLMVMFFAPKCCSRKQFGILKQDFLDHPGTACAGVNCVYLVGRSCRVRPVLLRQRMVALGKSDPRKTEALNHST